jgi:hypothetical protein
VRRILGAFGTAKCPVGVGRFGTIPSDYPADMRNLRLYKELWPGGFFAEGPRVCALQRDVSEQSQVSQLSRTSGGTDKSWKRESVSCLGMISGSFDRPVSGQFGSSFRAGVADEHNDWHNAGVGTAPS